MLTNMREAAERLIKMRQLGRLQLDCLLFQQLPVVAKQQLSDLFTIFENYLVEHAADDDELIVKEKIC